MSEVFDEPIKVNSSKQKVILSSRCRGDLDIKINDFEVTIRNVLYMDDLYSNLLSVYRLKEIGYNVFFKNNSVFI